MQKLTSFSFSDLQALQEIVDKHPHLHLDETQAIIRWKTGKVWHASMMWQHMLNMGCTLQAAVHEGKQRNEFQRDAFREWLHRNQHNRQTWCSVSTRLTSR
jgi:hypothetical protein